jgi:hypothetical protein
LDVTPNFTLARTIPEAAEQIVSVVTYTVTCIDFVVSPALDIARVEDVVDIMTVWEFLGPFLDCVEHIAMNLDSFVPEGRMVKSSKDVFEFAVSFSIPSKERGRLEESVKPRK